MDNNDQKTQLAREITRRKQSEVIITALNKELTSVKENLTSIEKNMEDRIRFDMLLSEISAHFISLPSDQIDDQIESAQRRVCEKLGLDMSVLWQREAGNPVGLVLTHIYRPTDDPPLPERMLAAEQVPWLFQQSMTGKIVAISSLDDMPAEAAHDIDTWRYYGIKTTLNLPLRTGGDAPFGVVSFNDMRLEKRNWSETLIKRLQLIAQIFANAIARKRSEEILRESEQRLSLATSAAGVGLWIMDIETEKVWASAKLRELFQFAPDEELNYESFVKNIHPEDLNQVKLGVQRALQSGKALDSDYRIILSDGVIRWISSRGNRHFKSTGEPDRILGVSVDITERKQMENQLKETLHFELLLSDISAKFVHSSSDQIDSTIEDAQRRVCECLGLDLSGLWQWTVDNPDRLMMTHLYRPLGGPPIPEYMDAKDFFPWSQKELKSGNLIIVSSMDNVPPEAAHDLEAWRHFGIKTTLTIPLTTGNGPIFGGISFNDMQQEREWSETIVKRLQVVAQIFSSAIAGKRSKEILRESEQRLSLATDAAGVGLWIMDIDTQTVWISSQLSELFCFAGDEGSIYRDFYEKTHPEDRDRFHQAVQQSIYSGENLHCDYRILLPDGNFRWICSRGHRRLKPDGTPDRLMGISLDITERMELQAQLQDRIEEIATLKQRLENENIYLQKEVKYLGEHKDFVGQSLAMKRILTEARQVAITDSTVLILGETGTGKELVARMIHQMSTRKTRPMVTINCASLPPTLIESELFGREKGAYTGAMTRMIGRFEIADGSTLFLDEIGDLPLEIQVKLLRVLEDGVFERLGSTKPIQVNTRIIAATNRDLEKEVADGRFRSDLFYRLNVFPIKIPPLRDRTEDIPLLVWAFVKEFKNRMGKEIDTVSKNAMDSLRSYAWPGNVRELRNVIEHALILSNGSTLVFNLPKTGLKENNPQHHLDDVDRQHILAVLKQTGGRVAAAAGIMGLKRSTLYSKMKKLGISRSDL